jgi:hypothetical protein
MGSLGTVGQQATLGSRRCCSRCLQGSASFRGLATAARSRRAACLLRTFSTAFVQPAIFAAAALVAPRHAWRTSNDRAAYTVKRSKRIFQVTLGRTFVLAQLA